MKKLLGLLSLGLVAWLVWRVAGPGFALFGAVGALALRVVFDRSEWAQSKVRHARAVAAAELRQPHQLSVVAATLLGTLLIVHASSLWDIGADVLSESDPAEDALSKQLDWLLSVAGYENTVVDDDARRFFKENHERFDWNRRHVRRRSGRPLGVEEVIERKYELIGHEVTLVGDLVEVVDYQDGHVGLWLWDADEQRRAEAFCALTPQDASVFSEGKRVRIEGTPLVFGLRNGGTEFSRSAVGFACARADISPYSDWSRAEIVDEYIDDLQNSEGWKSTLDRSREYWIDNYGEFRLDRVHRFDWRGLKRSSVGRLVWNRHFFDGYPVHTWGWVTNPRTSQRTSRESATYASSLLWRTAGSRHRRSSAISSVERTTESVKTTG